MISVVVIDDSAFMRKAIELMLTSDENIKVVALARDGEDGYEKVKKLRPDVVTLDLEMPRVNGMECLEMIMKNVPTPVLVVSSISTEGAQATLDALDKGAVDYIPKSQSFVAIDINKIKEELIEKVKTIAKRRRRLPFSQLQKNRQAKSSTLSSSDIKTFKLKRETRCVSIGVSTGGPPVVQKILSALPSNFPVPILIAQHMPKEFTKTFADRLNRLSEIQVKEAEHGDILSKGIAYVGRGGKHLVAKRRGIHTYAELTIHPEEHLYHPSADVLFSSACEVYGQNNVGIILTGMGKDGVIGLEEMKNKGGTILAQDEDSCVVYGMPNVAVKAGLVTRQLTIEGIISSLQSLTA